MNHKTTQLVAIVVAFAVGMVSAASVVMLGEDDSSDSDDRTGNLAPVASMFASATTVYRGDTVTFDASQSHDPDGNVTGLHFDFGDGTDTGWLIPGQNMIREHVYGTTGEFTASLKVKDDKNLESGNSMEITITVSEPPLPGNLGTP